MALAAASASAAVSIDWVTIGNPGNAAQSAANRTHAFDGDGFGAVADTFRIARNETTILDYTEFLNAVAATDTYSLYNTSMGTDGNIAGINRSGNSGSYTYSVTGSGARPITYVSWFDAARYTNWLGTGDTETGAYSLVGGQISGSVPERNAGASNWIPTENEWYKAAYYDPTKGVSGGYWLHGNQSDTMTTNTIGATGGANYFDGADFAVTQSGSYSGSQNYLTDAGAYDTDSQSFYGLDDVAGNVLEWNDLDAESGSVRGLRGGSWLDGEGSLRSSLRGVVDPSYENSDVGFRVASVPEPSSIFLTMMFTAAIAARRKR